MSATLQQSDARGRTRYLYGLLLGYQTLVSRETLAQPWTRQYLKLARCELDALQRGDTERARKARALFEAHENSALSR